MGPERSRKQGAAHRARRCRKRFGKSGAGRPTREMATRAKASSRLRTALGAAAHAASRRPEVRALGPVSPGSPFVGGRSEPPWPGDRRSSGFSPRGERKPGRSKNGERTPSIRGSVEARTSVSSVRSKRWGLRWLGLLWLFPGRRHRPAHTPSRRRSSSRSGFGLRLSSGALCGFLCSAVIPLFQRSINYAVIRKDMNGCWERRHAFFNT